MKKLLLVIPGHLGKDVGATATLESDGDGSFSFYTLKMQEERWINLQQAIGFCLGYALSDLQKILQVRLVLPKNSDLGFYDNGLINIYDFQKSVFSLEDRVKLANELDADVIEIHNNSAEFQASGFETLCFSKEDKNGKITESYGICEEIMNSIKNNMKIKIRNINPIYDYKQQKYIGRQIYLLKNVKNNCIITEGGFISNKKELRLLDVDLDSYNEQMGACIWIGYSNYFKKINGEIK